MILFFSPPFFALHIQLGSPFCHCCYRLRPETASRSSNSRAEESERLESKYVKRESTEPVDQSHNLYLTEHCQPLRGFDPTNRIATCPPQASLRAEVPDEADLAGGRVDLGEGCPIQSTQPRESHDVGLGEG